MLPMLVQNQDAWAASARTSGVYVTEAMRQTASQFKESCERMDESGRGLQLSLGRNFAGIGIGLNNLGSEFERGMREMLDSFDRARIMIEMGTWDYKAAYAEQARAATESAEAQVAAFNKVSQAWGAGKLPEGMNYTVGGWLAPYQSATLPSGEPNWQVSNIINVTLDGREIAAAVTEQQNAFSDRNGISAAK